MVELPQPVKLLRRQPVAPRDLTVPDPVRVEPVPDPRAGLSRRAGTAQGLDVPTLVGAVGLEEVHVQEDRLIPGLVQPADHPLGTRVHLQVLVAAGQPERLPEPGVVQKPRRGVALGAQVFGQGDDALGEHRRAAHRPVHGGVEAGEHRGHRRVSVGGGSGGGGEAHPEAGELVEVRRRAPGGVVGPSGLVEAHGVEPCRVQGQEDDVGGVGGERGEGRLQRREFGPHRSAVRGAHAGERGEAEAGHRGGAGDAAGAVEPRGEGGDDGG